MQILYFDILESTHLFLQEELRSGTLKPPVMVVAKYQSGGIGSRGNKWDSVEDGLYFSFAMDLMDLPSDLPMESMSIYMGYIFKEVLVDFNAEVWLKWPNDLYIRDKKVGGVLCTKIKENILIGIGINVETKNENFGALGIKESKDRILQDFIDLLKVAKKSLTWKQIFSKYALEFPNNFGYGFHHKGEYFDLKNTTLCEDGAIMLNGEKIYSLR